MTRPRALIIALLLLVSRPASAGALYGTVLIAGAPAAGITILISCPQFPSAGQPAARASGRTTTDAGGSYAIRVLTSGRCQMRVERNNVAGIAFDVILSDNPLRLDFEVDGALRRVR